MRRGSTCRWTRSWRRRVSWSSLAAADPAVANALLRHAHAGEVDLPPIVSWLVDAARTPADLADFTGTIADSAPLATGTVVLATFVLLFLMTGSVVVPIKAILMNIVSLGASLGVLVWVFQDGHLQGLLGYQSVGAVEVSIPVLVLAFGFGLSMDYEVFLLSRIVELHERGYSTNEAVRLGLQRSGKIITSAALLMCIVFAGFVLARVLAVKETGVALVLAIVIDATPGERFAVVPESRLRRKRIDDPDAIQS